MDLKKVPFKPRKLDEEIRERTAAIRLENCDVRMSNIFVSDADIGISMNRKTRLLLNDYHAVRTRKPLEVHD
jgi:hypothetical protein